VNCHEKPDFTNARAEKQMFGRSVRVSLVLGLVTVGEVSLQGIDFASHKSDYSADYGGKP
jgi:hypothetical protein